MMFSFHLVLQEDLARRGLGDLSRLLLLEEVTNEDARMGVAVGRGFQ